MLDATVSRNFFERQLIQLLMIIEHQQRHIENDIKYH